MALVTGWKFRILMISIIIQTLKAQTDKFMWDTSFSHYLVTYLGQINDTYIYFF